MKRYGKVLGVLAATLVLASTPVLGHIVTLKDVVDARAAKEWPTVYRNLRTAASHMAMIADPLGMAIAKQFPEKYANAKGITPSCIPARLGDQAWLFSWRTGNEKPM
jgi:hypothetical protein